MRFIKTIFCFTILLSFSLLTVSGQAANATKSYGKGNPFTIEQLPPGQFKQKLKVLPEQAQKNALAWMHEHSFTASDFIDLRVDDNGGIFYEDPAPVNTDAVSSNTPVLEELTQAETFSLHSKPGASRTVFIDMDGRVVSGTIWNQNSGTDPLLMRPYDSDGDETTFSQTELNAIAETWKRIAEDFAPFDIDVTTEEPSRLDSNVGLILVTPKADQNGNNIYNCSCGGVAYVGVWGRSDFASRYQPALVFTDGVGTGAHNISEAASHELGHNLGLSHDGTNTAGYYTGHGTGNVQWAPIMGVGYYAEVTQWSKGEYLNASQTQDDLQIIRNNLSDRADDHDNVSFANATPLNVTGNSVVSTNPVSDPFNNNPFNKGVIENRDDIDLFSFTTAAGELDLSVTPGWIENFSSSNNRGMNIDIEATLYDSDGVMLVRSNPQDDTFARLTTSLEPGTYYLAIDGIELGDVLGTGYSDYGSLGNYYINGTVPEGTIGAPTANFTFTCNELNCNYNASTSVDNEGDISSYAWDFGDGSTATGVSPSHAYANNGNFNTTLTVTDSDSLTDSISKTVTVYVPIAPTANFTDNCTDLSCSFDASSSSDDIAIATYIWNFGDGNTSAGITSTHSYASAGSYTVSLTVSDSDSLSDTAESSVTVTEPPPQAPAAPTNLSADAVVIGKGKNSNLVSVALSWNDNSNNETNFEIESCIETGKGKNKVCNFTFYTSVDMNVSSYFDSNPVANSQYRVRAINETGSSAYTNIVEP